MLQEIISKNLRRKNWVIGEWRIITAEKPVLPEMNQNTEVIDLVTDDHMTHRKYSTTVYRYFDLMGCYNNSVINLQYHIEIKMKTQKSLNI